MTGRKTLLLALVGGLLLAGLSIGDYSGLNQAGAEAAISPDPARQGVPVPIFQVDSTAALGTRTFAGRVEPLRTVDLAFQVSGQLIDLPPEEGDRVQVGAVIARIDPEDFRLALARAEAGRALARAEYERAVELVERSVAPQAQLDRARAELAEAEVAVDQARRALDQTVIEAPFEALVARRLAETWVNITPAAPVLRLQDVTEFLVAISLPEELAMRARTAPDTLEAVARFPALPDLELPLDLARFVTEADPVAQTYAVKLTLQGGDARILPGMTATVEIRLRTEKAGLLVPVAAVDTASAPLPRVWVVGEDGTVSPRDVTLGLPQGERISVTEGLSAGERIVATGWSRLEPGVRVRPAGL